MVKPASLKTIMFAGSLSLSAFLPQNVAAQDVSDSHLKAAKAAIAALKVTENFDNILPATAERLKSVLIRSNPNFSDEISLTVDNEAIKLAGRRGDLENEAGLIYAKRFTEDELNAITAFYNSQVGQKLLRESASAGRELVRAADIWSSGISRDLTDASNAALTTSLSSAQGGTNEGSGD